MTSETVQLEVTLLIKADGSDDAWQMQRLCQGLNVVPHGVLKQFIVKTDRENYARMRAWAVHDWEQWCRSQRNGKYAFQVLEVYELAEVGGVECEGNAASEAAADMSKDELIDVLLPEIDRRHNAEDELRQKSDEIERLHGKFAAWQRERSHREDHLRGRIQRLEAALAKVDSAEPQPVPQSPWLPDGWQVDRYTELGEIPAYVNSMVITLEISRIIPNSKEEPEEAPKCENCGGSGRVEQTGYNYVDRFTKWERKDPYTISVECSCCNGKGEQ